MADGRNLEKVKELAAYRVSEEMNDRMERLKLWQMEGIWKR